MPRFTIHLRNGRELDFESATVKLQTNTDESGKHYISDADIARKDNGLSLIFCDWTEVVALTRDTRRDDE